MIFHLNQLIFLSPKTEKILYMFKCSTLCSHLRMTQVVQWQGNSLPMRNEIMSRVQGKVIPFLCQVFCKYDTPFIIFSGFFHESFAPGKGITDEEDPYSAYSQQEQSEEDDKIIVDNANVENLFQLMLPQKADPSDSKDFEEKSDRPPRINHRSRGNNRSLSFKRDRFSFECAKIFS